MCTYTQYCGFNHYTVCKTTKMYKSLSQRRGIFTDRSLKIPVGWTEH